MFLAAFALYALTAQRGLGWGDSGQFQNWILGGADVFSLGESFSNLHPAYIYLSRIAAHSPFAINIVSAFFGALAVAGLYLATRSLVATILFALSHVLWWLSCVAEVQTMSLAFTVFGALAFIRWIETRNDRWFVVAAFISGLHLECHNFALLALPVYGVAALVRRLGIKAAVLSAFAFFLGAAFWIKAVFERGIADVLVGSYGAKVAGILPASWSIAAFNIFLAALSFTPPLLLLWLSRKDPKPASPATPWILALLGINALFFARYFVPDQFTFALPTLFFVWLIASRSAISRTRAAALTAIEIVLPVAAYLILTQLPNDHERTLRHPFRDDAAYFALPWKFNEDSAGRAALLFDEPWDGYNAERSVSK